MAGCGDCFFDQPAQDLLVGTAGRHPPGGQQALDLARGSQWVLSPSRTGTATDTLPAWPTRAGPGTTCGSRAGACAGASMNNTPVSSPQAIQPTVTPCGSGMILRRILRYPVQVDKIARHRGISSRISVLGPGGDAHHQYAAGLGVGERGHVDRLPTQ